MVIRVSPDVIDHVCTPRRGPVGDGDRPATERNRVADAAPAPVVQFRQEFTGANFVANADPHDDPDGVIDRVTDSGPAGAEQVTCDAQRFGPKGDDVAGSRRDDLCAVGRRRQSGIVVDNPRIAALPLDQLREPGESLS